MKVYLAGPIDGCTDSEANDWRSLAKEMCADIKILDPMSRDYRGREVSHYTEIVEYDLADINAADLILANCWKPGWGTPMEIMYAYLNDIPVVSVVPEGQMVSPWVQYHSVHVYRDLPDALCDIEAGIYG